MWRLMCLCVSSTLGQNPDRSYVCEMWDYRERCMVFDHDSDADALHSDLHMGVLAIG